MTRERVHAPESGPTSRQGAASGGEGGPAPAASAAGLAGPGGAGEAPRPLAADTLRRLRWRCRRGLLEVDLLLQRFAASGLHTLSAEEARQLEALLEYPDAVVLEWLLGREAAPSPDLAHVVGRIRSAASG